MINDDSNENCASLYEDPYWRVITDCELVKKKKKKYTVGPFVTYYVGVVFFFKGRMLLNRNAIFLNVLNYNSNTYKKGNFWIFGAFTKLG